MGRLRTTVLGIVYLCSVLLSLEVECRGGKGGSSRGYNRYSKQGSDNNDSSTDGLVGVSWSVWEIVGISFALVTVVGLLGFLLLYKFCDKLPPDQDETSKTVTLAKSEEAQSHTIDETEVR